MVLNFFLFKVSCVPFSHYFLSIFFILPTSLSVFPTCHFSFLFASSLVRWFFFPVVCSPREEFSPFSEATLEKRSWLHARLVYNISLHSAQAAKRNELSSIPLSCFLATFPFFSFSFQILYFCPMREQGILTLSPVSWLCRAKVGLGEIHLGSSLVPNG